MKNVSLNVLADAKGISPAEVDKLLSDPKAANAMLGDGKASAGFAKTYREFITLPSANAAFRRLFVDLGDKDQVSVLYHCTTGKDRTGWASAALLTLLGVPEDKVYEDYLKSNEYILPAYKNFIDRFVAGGGQPSIPQALLGVKPEYLQASLDQVKSQYGSIENYLTRDSASTRLASKNFVTDSFKQTTERGEREVTCQDLHNELPRKRGSR